MTLSDQTRQTIDELACILEEEEERQLALSPRRFSNNHRNSHNDPHQDLHHGGEGEEEHEEGFTTFVTIPREMLPCPMELRATVGPAVQLATKPQTSSSASAPFLLLAALIPSLALSTLT